MAEPWEQIGETTGCQMWGIMGRLLAQQETTPNEIDAIKRRLFAFPNEAQKKDIYITDIQQITGSDELRNILNEYDPQDLAYMFI